MNRTEDLTAALEALTLRELSRAWVDYNRDLFAGCLRPPTLNLSDTRGRLGQWARDTRTLELSREAVLTLGWGVVLELLKHEMAHQYTDEVLGAREETAHGETFQRVCEARGIDGRAKGTPEAGATDGSAAVLERIRKLLALARSPNEHEAQSAMDAARRLMLKHNLEQVSLGERRDHHFRHLGAPSGRVEAHLKFLAVILHRHFFVETIWVPVWRPREGLRGTVLEVCGTRDNLELAAYVYSFLTHTAEALWTVHKRARGIARDRDRRSFLSGVMQGFLEKLDGERRGDHARGLLWLGDPALNLYLRQRYPRIRTVQTGSRVAPEAFGHGKEAGKNLVLHRAMEGSAQHRGNLLGPG
ncbi:MAG: DUF2786 domain-containing protein [Deltaproteobacteria bacterium]|nr:DUF2786 domain-containing protein [Deltaproteobacteria bacterium]